MAGQKGEVCELGRKTKKIYSEVVGLKEENNCRSEEREREKRKRNNKKLYK